MEYALTAGFNIVPVDTWLDVIPQIIARLHANIEGVRRLIQDLLIRVARDHPQALIYPLMVAKKSQADSNAGRINPAFTILEKMREHSALLVSQAEMVSEELIRVAILWLEMWHEGLEEASRLYFGENNEKGLFRVLLPLHEMMGPPPTTLSEISFHQSYGRDLKEAFDWGQKYLKSNRVADLNQAWDLYYCVFRRINKQLPQLTTLDLQYVSNELEKAENLELAVPGSYRAGEPIVRISKFKPVLTVISSKQRPRKLTIVGEDGVDYSYLLKGHEDLRQDERVMQLFGLVNQLLNNDQITSQIDLNIIRYAAVPLSPNSGVIGWVPNCDTLHALIKEYRDSRKIMINIEHRLMVQMAPDYDNLTLIQKLEVFEHALCNTTGQDLYKVLWLKSRNAEAWLERRTNYTRSLAVMSVVGYILGLGDRHPSNIMLERISGKIMHIDYGDCFEVAQHREKFPERVPFRLTRMLINAMEVSGVEGNFRFTCENVMRVLRENKNSVMAVLEAFVHDPLLSWRLLQPAKEVEDANGNNGNVELDSSEDSKLPDNRPQGKRPRATAQQEHQQEHTLAELNEKAVSVITRVNKKLTGRDFDIEGEELGVQDQVERLIQQARSNENLAQCYIGWCPFW